MLISILIICKSSRAIYWHTNIGIMNVAILSERELCMPFVLNVICIYAQKILEEYFKLNVGCISSKLEDNLGDLTSQFYPGVFV